MSRDRCACNYRSGIVGGGGECPPPPKHRCFRWFCLFIYCFEWQGDVLPPVLSTILRGFGTGGKTGIILDVDLVGTTSLATVFG